MITSINIDEDMWNEFKGVCAVQNKTMKDVLAMLIQEYLNRYYTEN